MPSWSPSLLLALALIACGDKTTDDTGGDGAGADAGTGDDGGGDDGGAGGDDGVEAVDADGDGFDEGDDCDDEDADINPGAEDVPGDGIDQDCDGADATRTAADLVAGDLVLVEIMKNPQLSDDADGEWLEVVNRSGAEVDLIGLTVQVEDDNGSVVGAAAVTESVPLAAGARAVLGRTATTTDNGGVSLDATLPSLPELSNDSGGVTLLTSEGGVEIDAVVYNAAETFPSGRGRSLSLCPGAEADNHDGTQWRDARQTYGSGDHGTPGAENDACTVAIGEYAALGSLVGRGADALIGNRITVATDTTLDMIGGVVLNGTGNVSFGLYRDQAGSPGDRVAATGAIPIDGPTRAEQDVFDIPLTAGDYWLVANTDTTMGFAFEADSGVDYVFATRAFSDGYASSFGGHARYSGAHYSYYLLTY